MAIALLLFACIPVVIKGIAANIFTIGIARLSLALLLVGSFIVWRRRKQIRHMAWRSIALPLIVIGVVFALHWLTYFLAIKMSTASIGALGVATYGVHLLILSAVIQKQSLKLTDVIAIVTVVTGSILVLYDGQPLLDSQFLPGFLIGVVSGFLFAVLPLLHQHYQAIDHDMRTLGQFVIAAGVFLLFLPQANWQLTQSDWLGLLFLGVFGTAVMHTLWVRVTTLMPTKITSVTIYLYLPVVMLLSRALLNEPLHVSMLIGAALIVAGNVFAALVR